MQIEFQRCVQRVAETSGGEVDALQIVALFRAEYLCGEGRIPLHGLDCRFSEEEDGSCTVAGMVSVDGTPVQLEANGNGPIDAAFGALRKALGLSLRICDYNEHALGQGSDAKAVAYVEVSDEAGRCVYGAGCHASTLRAGLEAVVSAMNRYWAEAERGEP
jgi:2-isopropylmalate synthase